MKNVIRQNEASIRVELDIDPKLLTQNLIDDIVKIALDAAVNAGNELEVALHKEYPNRVMLGDADFETQTGHITQTRRYRLARRPIPNNRPILIIERDLGLVGSTVVICDTHGKVTVECPLCEEANADSIE